MTTRITIIALLVAASAASAASDMQQFLTYESNYNKAYRTVSEQQAALANYQATDALLNSLNAAAAADPNPNAARVAHNFLSDLSVAQRSAYLGRNTPAGYVNDVNTRPTGRGRGLQDFTPVDHAVDGFVHPVKD